MEHLCLLLSAEIRYIGHLRVEDGKVVQMKEGVSQEAETL